MRIAYVCRDLASNPFTGPGARTFSTACALAAAGHDVHLISESLARPSRSRTRRGPRATVDPGTRYPPAHRYFTDQHAYADSSTTRCNDSAFNKPFDVVEFRSTTAEALTTVRAKRLLGEFAATALLCGWAPNRGTLSRARRARVVDLRRTRLIRLLATTSLPHRRRHC